MGTRFSVAVIGGGIAGLSIAATMARRGVAVRVIDAGELGCGASGGHTGLLVPPLGVRFDKPFGRFGWECLRRYPAWLADLGIVVPLESRTSIRLCPAPLKANAILAPRQEWLEAPQLWERFPKLLPRAEVCGGFVTEGIATLTPHVLLDALVGVVREHGGAYQPRQEVRSVTPLAPSRDNSPRFQVECAGGDKFDVSHLVLAAGAESNRFLKCLGCELPLSVDAGMMVGCVGGAAFDEVVHDDNNSVVMKDSTIWITGSFGAAGQNAEALRTRLEHRVTSILRNPGAAKQTWTGMRCRVSGGFPFVGEVPSNPGLIVATGLGSNGFLFAPLVATMVADELLGMEVVGGEWRNACGVGR